MTLLIISPCFGMFGGLEAFVFALAEEMHRCAGLHVTLCFKRTKGFAMDPLFQKKCAQGQIAPVFVDRASPSLARLIWTSDVVHCQNPCLDVALLARVLRRPLAMTIHGHYERATFLRDLVVRVASWLANRRWYNSEFVWDSWEPRRRRSSSGRLPIVSDLPQGSVPISERRGFLFVARWIANKGLEELIDAYAGADLDRERWPLILIGDGPLRPGVETRLKSLDLQHVKDLGYVDDLTRDENIRRAKWMVVPPHTNEGLGLTAIEARNVGVPCIITRDGGLPEAGGRHALVCEPGNVAQLCALLERAARMPEPEYAALSDATHRELLEYLEPLSVYGEHFKSLYGRKNMGT